MQFKLLRRVHLPIIKRGAPIEYIPRPEKGEVLYADPNPDGSRKACLNCIMWVSDNAIEDGAKCLIHEKSLQVEGNMVCGYHVYGEPMDKWMDHPGITPVQPDMSGLILAPYGTSCDICLFFVAGRGTSATCLAVNSDTHEVDAFVEALGCCSRWAENPEATEGLEPIEDHQAGIESGEELPTPEEAEEEAT